MEPDLQRIKKYALYNLCSRDPRNPEFEDVYGWMDKDDRPEPRKDCSCDTCFYGRDKMALTILELLELITQQT